MKVNVLNVTLICAISSVVFLSVNAVPLSDAEKPSESTVTGAVDNVSSPQAVNEQEMQDASVEETDASDIHPPLLFPIDEDKILPKNETALKILQGFLDKDSFEEEEPNLTESSASTTSSTSTTTKTSVTSTTMGVSTTTTKQLASTLPSTKSSTSTTSASVAVEKSTTEANEDDYENIENEGEKSDVENIQEDEKEYDLEEEFARNGSDKATINIFNDPVVNEPALHSGHFALIFASILVVFSVFAYIGLVLWRNTLERRYGMRQRLVTEDDYYPNNDIKYFGL